MNEQTLEELKDRVDAGDRLAAVDALIECHRHGLTPPKWVLTWHAEAWTRYYNGSDLSDACFELRMDGGRQARPRQEHKDLERRESVFGAVHGSIHHGLHGWDAFDGAARVLNSSNPDEPTTACQVQKRNEYQQSRARNQPYWLQDPNRHATMCSGILSNLTAHMTPGVSVCYGSSESLPPKATPTKTARSRWTKSSRR